MTLKKISEVIDWLEKAKADFGDSCVYYEELCWGGIALNMNNGSVKSEKTKQIDQLQAEIKELNAEYERYAIQIIDLKQKIKQAGLDNKP